MLYRRLLISLASYNNYKMVVVKDVFELIVLAYQKKKDDSCIKKKG